MRTFEKVTVASVANSMFGAFCVFLFDALIL